MSPDRKVEAAKTSLLCRVQARDSARRASSVAAKLAAVRSKPGCPCASLRRGKEARAPRLKLQSGGPSSNRCAQSSTGRGKVARGRSSLARYNPSLFQVPASLSSPVEASFGRSKLEFPGTSSRRDVPGSRPGNKPQPCVRSVQSGFEGTRAQASEPSTAWFKSRRGGPPSRRGARPRGQRRREWLRSFPRNRH